MSDEAPHATALRAIQIAAQVEGRLNDHEKHCTERYQEIRDGLGDVKKSIASHETKRSEQFNSIYTRIDALARSIYISVILLLIAMLGYLLTNGVPWRPGH